MPKLGIYSWYLCPLVLFPRPSWVVIPRTSVRKALVQASQTVHRSGAGALAKSLLSAIDVITREVDRLTKRVLDEVRIEPTCRRLMTAQGVGHSPPLRSAQHRSVGSLPQSRDVGAHLGLTPRRYQSGETDVQGRISRCGDELARTTLYEAARSLLIRSTKWSALRAWGMNVAKRRGMARARVAVARKLAVILHRIWADAPSSVGANRPQHR